MKAVLLNSIINNIKLFGDRNAFFIQDQFYTYQELSKKVAGISEALQDIPQQNAVGIISTDTLETYASIIALWINELIFVPISPANSTERNESAIHQTDLKYVLASSSNDVQIINSEGLTVIETASLSSNNELVNLNLNPENILYLLFTSGSTGTPKGVPITITNLETFITSFLKLDYQLDEEDRFLQIYDLSFDASVHCYVLPLFLGACIYTVPTDEVKYLYAYRLMKEQNLTFVKMPPSTITYLQPYFSKINLEELKYTLFGGEALQSNLAKAWKKCAPNASINNVYGPTEATINCFYYDVTKTIKSFNDVVCIGQPFGDTQAIVLDENNNVLTSNNKGELCLYGNQITQGYWKNDQKNKDAFIEIEYNNELLIFYRTGDLVYFDNEGDFYYCDRIDHQIQIQGYRVELGEIEHHTRNKTNLNHIIAMPSSNDNGTTQLILFLENYDGEIDELKNYLLEKIPAYMIPHQIINLDSFPLSTSGKVDRTKLKELM